MKTIVTKDIFEIVTSLIIQKLEEGIIPWKQPWMDLGPPRNLITQRPYRGINLLLLGSLGYPSNEYLTFRQVQDIGGKVKKGEKAHLVVLWIWIDYDETRAQDVIPRKCPLMRYYFVFNASQCTGLPERAYPLVHDNIQPLEKCEAVIIAMPQAPKIVHNENRAYYHPFADYINMPLKQAFKSIEAYYGTLFHELIHSTGHQDRLNRKELTEQTNFGSELYSIEELTAEIGRCYLCAYTGIEQEDFANNVSYIDGWLDKLRRDKRFIVYASSQAQKAVDYILNIKPQENELVDTLNDGYETA